MVGLFLVLTACQAAGSSPGASEVSSVAPSSTPTPTVKPTPSLPVVMPPPTDLPTDGTCEEGYPCLGLLEAGKAYTTIAFTPAITFTMPEGGWENISDEGGVLVLFSLGHPGDAIAFFRNPWRGVPARPRWAPASTNWRPGWPPIRWSTSRPSRR